MTEVGIVLCVGYLPIYRIDRDQIAASWGSSSLGGERTVANNDEDVITLAVEAARNCLRGYDREEVTGFFWPPPVRPIRKK
jgi:hydroxymethylglutaryl-CoA synthase